MSRARLHVFVEGRELDGYVYGKVLQHECPRPFEYTLKRADEVPGSGGGGKKELKKLHDWLRRQGALVSNFKGHRFACVVMLDKDIDDILRTKKRSSHVIYTPTYDLEGHVYLHGNLRDAIAASCSLDAARVSVSDYGDARRWALSAAGKWKDWVYLCVATQVLDSRGVCNFGVPSRVNNGFTGAADRSAVVAHEAQVIAKSRCDPSKVASRQASVQRMVDSRFATGRAPEAFKGKWFGDILAEEIEGKFPSEFKRVGGFKSRVVGHLAQSLPSGGSWADPFAVPIRAILAAL